jgi:hypothetical protein
MAKALEGFHARGDSTGYTFYAAGDDVPDDVAKRVNPDLLDEAPEQEDVDTSAFSGEAFDAAVEQATQGQLEDAVNAALEVYREREQAAYDALADQDEPFDPSVDGVNAGHVKAYLEGLDRGTVNGQAEFDRVVELENGEDGKKRSSAIPD